MKKKTHLTKPPTGETSRTADMVFPDGSDIMLGPISALKEVQEIEGVGLLPVDLLS